MAEVKVEIDAVTDVKVEVEEIPNTIKPYVTVKVEAGVYLTLRNLI